MYIIPKDEAYKLAFLLTDATNNEDAELDLELSADVYISKNGGAFAAYAGTITEIGRGWYYIDLTTTHTNTEGPLIVEAEVSGTTNTWRWACQVVPRAVTLDDAEPNRIADHTLRRSMASARASSDGDTVGQRSLMGQIAKYVNRTRINGSSLEVYEEDDTTLYYSQGVTTNEAAAPIVEVD